MNHVPVRVPLPSVKNNSTARSPTLFRYLGRKGGLLPPCTYPFDNGGTGPPRKMLSHVPIAHAAVQRLGELRAPTTTERRGNARLA